MISDTRRIAAIDVGSNSVRLLVADIRGGFIFPILRDKRTTRLIQGLNGGVLDADSIARTASAIRDFSEAARAAGADEVLAFGTSAMRDGVNRDDLIDAAGMPISLIPGEEEALLAYAGAQPEGEAGVLDIGGGSTEWLIGKNGRLTDAVSTRIGAARLYQMARGTPSPRWLIDRASAAMAEAGERFSAYGVSSWYGVGGSITTLAAMLLQLAEYDREAVDGFIIREAQARSWLDLIWAMPVHLRAELRGLEKERADIIPSGIAILIAFFELSGVKQIRVSASDNLEGFMRLKMVQGA